jgi:quercetin dioxygenase-like cupin family protein
VSGPIVVRPGEGARVGNVEFLARSRDTPRFTLGIIDFAAGRLLEAHVHDDEDDAFYILQGELTVLTDEGDVKAPAGTFVLVPPGVRHGLRNDTGAPVRILNVHAPAGFDRRIGLAE